MAGAIAKALVPGTDPGGIIVTTLLGIVDAMVPGVLGRALGIYHAGDADLGVTA